MRANILALGKSIHEYKYIGGIEIGVNDVNRFIDTEYLLVLDHPESFTEEREKYITSSSGTLITNIYAWDSIVNRKIHRINLNNYPVTPSGLCDLSTLNDKNMIPYSNNTPFVACIMAYHFGAKEIVIYGADFNRNYKSHEHNTALSIQHFFELAFALKIRGVNLYTGSKNSRLIKVLPFKK